MKSVIFNLPNPGSEKTLLHGNLLCDVIGRSDGPFFNAEHVPTHSVATVINSFKCEIPLFFPYLSETIRI